jgi:hypothetical protein
MWIGSKYCGEEKWFRAEAEVDGVGAKQPVLGNWVFSPNPTRHRTLSGKTVQF